MAADATEKATLYSRLLWRPPLRSNAAAVVAACCWIDGRGPMALLDLADRPRRILLAPLYKKSDRWLLIEASEDFDIDEASSALLDAVDEALGTTASAAAV